MHNGLSAGEAARMIREGRLSSVELVKSCLDHIGQTDGQLKAWAHLNPDYALEQAAEMDRIRTSGFPIGPLHGVPVGLKDIVDTKDFPTECGTPIFKGRKPDRDATLVQRLRESGAVVLGKTVTTELAFVHPAETRNPHNAGHSPGGSSSGSAAAVAAFHVPLAVGTQTNGSVIRPASFCGIFGFKPTRGIISRRGLLQTSSSLDQVGVFGRTLNDVALLADVLSGYDACDPLSYPRPRPQMAKGAREQVPIEPVFAWFDLPFADRLTADAEEGLQEVVNTLGGKVERLPAPDVFNDLVAVQAHIHEYEICHHLADLFSEHWNELSPTLQPVVERGRKISDERYSDSLEVMASATSFFTKFFNGYDAVITPAATGEAPVLGGGTGDPIFSTIWTLCGLPCLNLPLLVGESGMPIGVQLVGSAEQDDRLLRTASWMLNELQPAAS